jgi:hypothetical protein
LNKYQLYVRVNGRWDWLCDIEAESHPAAFRKAMLCLTPEHYDKPIRLEQPVLDDNGPSAERK